MRNPDFSPFFSIDILYTFVHLLLILFSIKALIVFYRMKSGTWPVSLRYLWSIIEWRKEVAKILFLYGVAIIWSAVH